MKRRDFIIGAAAGGVACGVGGALSIGPLFNRDRPAVLNFTKAQADALTAVTEQMIPADDLPGATEAGVVEYIDRQTAEGKPHAGMLDGIRKWLDELDALCAKENNTPFAKLAWDAQTAVLKKLEKSQGFQTVLTLTNQGYFGSPVFGGNRNYPGYHLVGLDQPRVCGRMKPNGPMGPEW